MNLKDASVNILNQLSTLLHQLDSITYTAPLDLLSGSSIGMHIRHIVEFYDCLLKGAAHEIIDYDARKRDILLETDRTYTLDFIQRAIERLQVFEAENQTFLLLFSLSPDTQTEIATTFKRELAYNIEHAIHHMAIIKIAVKQYHPTIILAEGFGVAYATIKYQRELQA
jgi:uncharacterized damage-inducible protein DinB